MKTVLKNTALFLIVLLMFLIGNAQNETDALRYSMTHFGGTSRYVSMGGAFGALGGDVSALTTNPAGIGVFRKSEFTFTPSLYQQLSTTSHYDKNSFDSKSNLNIQNVGLAGTFETGNSSGWLSANLGISYNRLGSFQSKLSIQGVNTESTLLDVFKSRLEAKDTNQFGPGLAWYLYLIDTVNGKLTTGFPNFNETQTKTITRSGGLSETAFSFGGNYDNRFYLGATFGFASVRFEEVSSYQEISSPGDTVKQIKVKSFTYDEKLTTVGTGFNLKLGAIYRINDYVRLGGAVHTPTFYTLSDNYSTEMSATGTMANGRDTTYSTKSPIGNFNYNLVTPFKAIASAAFVYGQHGLISADYEFVNYSLARLGPQEANQYNFQKENQNIQSRYKPSGNIRIGAEYRIDMFTLRAGYAHYGNPYSSNVANTMKNNTVTLGFGIRGNGFYFDLAYALGMIRENYYLYDPSIAKVQPTSIALFNHNVLATIGFRY